MKKPKHNQISENNSKSARTNRQTNPKKQSKTKADYSFKPTASN